MNNILTITNAVIEALIMIFCFNGFMHKKQEKYRIAVITAVILINISKNFITLPQEWNLILSILAAFGVAFANYTDKTSRKFFSVGIYVVIMLIAEIISGVILSEWLNIDYENVPVLNIELMASFTNMISFILILYIVVIPAKKIRDVPLKYWVMMLILPIFSAFLIIVFDLLIMNTQIPNKTLYSIFIVAGLLYVNIMLFDFFENYSARIRLRESEIIRENNDKNYKILKSNEEDLRILKHDLLRHINVIKELLKKDKVQEINDYINKLDDVAGSINSVTYTGHLTLDSILNVEAAKAKSENVRYLVKSNVQSDINIDDYDLTTILCNALDNAIEAAVKADEKYVVATINVYSDSIDIVINNSYNTILLSDANMRTTKEDTVNHGFGISSIRKVVEKYDGKIQIERSDGINTTEIQLRN